MLWKGRRQSSNVEDRRGMSARKGMVGGGLGTIVILLAIYFLGGDPSQVLNTLQVDDSQTTSSYVGTPEENELAQFVSVVLADTEDVWSELFRQAKDLGDVQIHACADSMEMFHITQTDLDPLVDGVWGVASFFMAAEGPVTFI